LSSSQVGAQFNNESLAHVGDGRGRHYLEGGNGELVKVVHLDGPLAEVISSSSVDLVNIEDFKVPNIKLKVTYVLESSQIVDYSSVEDGGVPVNDPIAMVMLCGELLNIAPGRVVNAGASDHVIIWDSSRC
jgi:hypothetical protein